MNIKKNKCKKNFILLNRLIPFTIFIILLFLTIFSFLPKPKFISQRKLQTTERSQGINVTENITNSEPKEKDLGRELTACFVMFCFMAFYIIARLNTFPDYIREKKNDLYTFIYFANNETLIASGVNIINLFDPNSGVIDQVFNYGPLFPTSLIYLIGGLCFIVNLVKSNCDPNIFFSCGKLCSIAKLPCFVWSLIPLANNCCKCTTIITCIYEDGHVEDNACCVCIWNLIIKFLKFISYLYTLFSFYIFYVVFIIGWFIAKLIYQFVLCCRKNENNIPNDINEPENIQMDSNQDVNNNNGNGEKDYNDPNLDGVENKDKSQVGAPPIFQNGVITININNNIKNDQNNPNDNNQNPERIWINQTSKRLNNNQNSQPFNTNQNSPNGDFGQNSQYFNSNKNSQCLKLKQNSQDLNLNQNSLNGDSEQNYPINTNKNNQNKINNQNNLNAIINQNQTLNTNLSQNDLYNKPDIQNNENIDYPSEEQEDIKQELNSSTDKEVKLSIVNQGNPAPIINDNVFQNTINESQDKTYKQSEKDEDVDFQIVPNFENNA